MARSKISKDPDADNSIGGIDDWLVSNVGRFGSEYMYDIYSLSPEYKIILFKHESDMLRFKLRFG